LLVLLLSVVPSLWFPVPGASQETSWSVETSTGPTRSLSFEATEGTWISVDVSPDGERIAFDLLGTIYEMSVAGGDATALTSGRSWNLSPRYSPDGGHIAFSSDRSGSHQIWILDRQSGQVRSVSGWVGANVHRPSWSKDGRRVYASASGDGVPNQLVAFGLDGGQQTLVVGRGGVNGAAPLSNGKMFLYEHQTQATYPFGFNPYVIPPGGPRIETFDETAGTSRVLIERPGGAFQPTLSPSGTRLAYVHRSMEGTVLLIMDLETREERVLLAGLDRDRQDSGSGYGPYPNLAWHPDGRRIVLGYQGGIHSVDVESGESRPIEFRAPVRREMSETIRFATTLPEDRAQTRNHRWAHRTPQGIVFETLGDLWLHGDDGPRRLTDSEALETSPVIDPGTGTVYYASWTDRELGAVYRLPPGGTARSLTNIASQYGSLTLSPGGESLAYVRGTGGLHRGTWLSNQADFELLVWDAEGGERWVTGIEGQPLEYANIAGKIPPAVRFDPRGESLYFTEFGADGLVLKRIRLDGSGETVLYQFPHAVDAVLSPDLEWIAIREYHRSYITPFQPAGAPITLAPYDGTGFSIRVDAEDGGYLNWSDDGQTLEWTRGSGFYEKTVKAILAEARGEGGGEAGANESWATGRIPGSTANRTELAIEFEVDKPDGIVALTGVRVVTMNADRDVLENATVLIEGQRIAAIGPDVEIPADAEVFDLSGNTIIPGLVDAHAHPHIEHSSLHVIEQAPTYLSGALAYGVTTMVEVYGNEYRDGWLSDMLRAGKMVGPRFLTTGSVIFGRRRGGRLRMFRPIETLDDAREQVRWNRDFGAIAVKDYAQSTRKRRHLVATAARELGLNVLSESSADPQMNLTQIMDGVTGIEHSMGLTPMYDDVVKFWGGTSAGMTPTLLVVYNGPMGEGWYHQGSKLWEDPKLTNFVDPISLMRVRRSTHLWPEDMYAWEMAAEVRELYEAGTSLQVGAHGQMSGLGTHWELELLSKGGFSPAQILEIATIKGAAQHGLDAQIGSLEPGKLADLVVLTANPLDDIRNASSIKYVMKGGNLYDGRDAARVWPNPRPAHRPYFRRN